MGDGGVISNRAFTPADIEPAFEEVGVDGLFDTPTGTELLLLLEPDIDDADDGGDVEDGGVLGAHRLVCDGSGTTD